MHATQLTVFAHEVEGLESLLEALLDAARAVLPEAAGAYVEHDALVDVEVVRLALLPVDVTADRTVAERPELARVVVPLENALQR